jgi:hypothetical protein
VATHRRPLHVFQVGSAASFGVKEIAENGNNAPLLAALAGQTHVSASLETTTGPLVPAGKPGAGPPFNFGDSVTFEITADQGAKYLSFVAMLICTNDGFTGVDGLRLPQHVGGVVEVSTNGYDAGTEINTQAFVDIVPPCQALINGIIPPVDGTGTSNPALAEGGVIRHHPGIQAMLGNLTLALHGWTDPVATIEIERVS